MLNIRIMKKIFYLFALLLVMCSCNLTNRPAEIVQRTEEEIIIKMDIIRHFEYQGHEYISFQYSPSPQQSYMGIVHDPNCNCYESSN